MRKVQILLGITLVIMFIVAWNKANNNRPEVVPAPTPKIDNSLTTSATPYDYCYSDNEECKTYGCSNIKVQSPSNSDVLVTIKKGSQVARHAYIVKSSSYTFEIPNGGYQVFFYYGRDWNPDKVVAQTDCGSLKGGFNYNERFGKDLPVYLDNQVLTYELILQSNGNFSQQPSDASEAF